MYLSVIVAFISFHQCSSYTMGILDQPWNPLEASKAIKEVVVDAGETIQLQCEGQKGEKIRWEYPSMKAKTDDEGYGSASIRVMSSDGDYEVSLLTIENATMKDTGRYLCFCGGMNNLAHSILHSQNNLKGRKVVTVFVRDGSHIFLSNSPIRQAITGIIHSSVTLPCGVSDPDATVYLIRTRGQRSKVVSTNVSKYMFSTLKGFRIERLSVKDQGTYTCRAIKGNLTEDKRFLLVTRKSMPLLLKPVLTSRGPRELAVGQSLTLKCRVPVGMNQLTSIQWFKDNQEIKASSRITIETPQRDPALCSNSRARCSFVARYRRIEGGYEKISSRLRIQHVDTEDEGHYICKAWSSGLTKESQSVSVVVSDEHTIIPTIDNL